MPGKKRGKKRQVKDLGPKRMGQKEGAKAESVRGGRGVLGGDIHKIAWK